ncbi:HAD hydrolase-like protein [Lapidilactobacillus luobeiensis]|uniref:HAD hydrolase-like protein n=1 Tax=Lapidilactobacillus luobeiensis TaxID=2950371 RepID=UPI0021C39980|nr:HAD hydrolase-like protein [Lapidilactobacillus luobeiensis]
MIKNLIWDYDGTLYDTYPKMLLCLRQALADFGQTSLDQDELYRLIKIKSIRFALTYYQQVYGLDRTQVEQRFQFYLTRPEAPSVKPFQGVAEVLAQVVASGGVNLLETHNNQGAIAQMRQDGLWQYFAGGVTADDDFPRKPDPSGVNALVTKFNLAPQKTAMVGDRRLDIEAGERAGIQTIYFDPDLFADAPMATYTVDQIVAIVPLLKVD